MALINARASWTESINVSGVPGPTLRGSGTDWGAVFGGYIAGNAAWELNDRWSIVGSVQYQYLNNYTHAFSGRTVEADLTHGIFITVGVGYKFKAGNIADRRAANRWPRSSPRDY